MKTQGFKGRVGKVHEIRLGNLLNMPLNPDRPGGIDLLDKYKGVEVKSSKIEPFKPRQ